MRVGDIGWVLFPLGTVDVRFCKKKKKRSMFLHSCSLGGQQQQQQQQRRRRHRAQHRQQGEQGGGGGGGRGGGGGGGRSGEKKTVQSTVEPRIMCRTVQKSSESYCNRAKKSKFYMYRHVQTNSPNQQGWDAQRKSSRNEPSAYRFCIFGTELYAQSALINKSSLLLSFVTCAFRSILAPNGMLSWHLLTVLAYSCLLGTWLEFS